MCLGQVFLEPLSEFLAERLVLFAEVEVHASSPYASATNPRPLCSPMRDLNLSFEKSRI
jgi:hypothetical protein